MRTKTEQPAVAFNATKDDDDLLEKKSVIFCWLTEITLSLHPGKATANQQTHHFSCVQKLRNVRLHSMRRKMMMIYLKRRVSSFADYLKSLYPFIQGKQPQIGKHIIFDADKNWATCGRIQRDERWWWSTWKEECHLLLTNWNHFIPSSRESNRK